MAGHDKYAETARNVAANRTFWGYHANQHLQREAERALGRPLNQGELDSIMYDIANGDLTAREASVLGGRGIGLTSGEIAQYHFDAFGKKLLPRSAYLGGQWQDLIGPAWSAAAGTPTKDYGVRESAKAYLRNKLELDTDLFTDFEEFLRSVGQNLGLYEAMATDGADYLDWMLDEYLAGLDERYPPGSLKWP